MYVCICVCECTYTHTRYGITGGPAPSAVSVLRPQPPVRGRWYAPGGFTR